ncbi:hypothetical protein OIU74_017099 [Salix koriyanagi]|uniref:Uncharacterized protein n=1 Tax=Salix koriyanagi TaxID=2511006 RepID=A0A9Q0PI89_9ROSI|nr:hypothetical protein OIU74_017099 [Salix koriyanagi]
MATNSWGSYCCEGDQGGMDGLRAKGEKPDLAPVTCDVDATDAGDESGTGQAWGGAIISKLPPFLSFTGSPSV